MLKLIVVYLTGVLLLNSVLQCAGGRSYIVNSNVCKIEDADPFEPSVMAIFKRLEYMPCKSLQPLTRVEYNSSSNYYRISIDRTAFQKYSKLDVQEHVKLSCCYMEIVRYNEKTVNISGDCLEFNSGDNLPKATIGFIVQCYANNKLIYTNGHATVPELNSVRQRLSKWKDIRGTARRAPSVLIIGIDTISRLHLRRAMPRTQKFLEESGWYELAGYNKVADNTLPNMLALTTGYSLSKVLKRCNPNLEGGLDRCSFIWKQFQEHGFVTAFGEDATMINTFNYKIEGFRNAPVDYYLRPYLMAVEQTLDVGVQAEPDNQICVGFQYASEHVYDYALEFARRYRNDTSFGFFWTNTHSHGNSVSRTSAMDEYLRTYLQRLEREGIMENSIVVFLSDHGMREGPTRNSPLGWLEERLPFLYIWLPMHLRQSHPEFVQALKLNRQRLSSPYDMYATFKDILQLSAPSQLQQSQDHAIPSCPKCQSLLQPLPFDRTCDDAGIADHWCTCRIYNRFSNFSALHNALGRRAVKLIDNILAKNATRCQPLTLAKIPKAYMAMRFKDDDPNVSIYRLQLETIPNHSLYEVTMRYNSKTQKETITGISQLAKPNKCNGELEEDFCRCR